MRKTHLTITAAAALSFCLMAGTGTAAPSAVPDAGKVTTQAAAVDNPVILVRGRGGFGGGFGGGGGLRAASFGGARGFGGFNRGFGTRAFYGGRRFGGYRRGWRRGFYGAGYGGWGGYGWGWPLGVGLGLGAWDYGYGYGGYPAYYGGAGCYRY